MTQHNAQSNSTHSPHVAQQNTRRATWSRAGKRQHRPWSVRTGVIKLSRKLTATYRIRAQRYLSRLLAVLLCVTSGWAISNENFMTGWNAFSSAVDNHGSINYRQPGALTVDTILGTTGASGGGQLINSAGTAGINTPNGRYRVYSGNPSTTDEDMTGYAKRHNADSTFVSAGTASTFVYRIAPTLNLGGNTVTQSTLAGSQSGYTIASYTAADYTITPKDIANVSGITAANKQHDGVTTTITAIALTPVIPAILVNTVIPSVPANPRSGTGSASANAAAISPIQSYTQRCEASSLDMPASRLAGMSVRRQVVSADSPCDSIEIIR